MDDSVQAGQSQAKSRPGDGKELSSLDARVECHEVILGVPARDIK